jgi:hypothetical protein
VLRRRGLLARIGIVLLLVCAGLVAAVGGISLPATGLVAILLASAVSACLGAGVARESSAGGRDPADVAWRAAVGTIAALLVLNGLVVLAGNGVAAGFVGVVGVAVAARWLLRSTGDGRRPGAAAAVIPLVDPGDVRGLSVAQLGREWVRTSAALRQLPDPAVRQALVHRRQEALDELERRDPAGFAQWLAAGATVDDDPTRYVAERPRDEGPATGSQAA